MGDMPNDPFTELQTGMAGLHELHLSLVDSGFSPDHSIKLLQAILHATVLRRGPSE